MSNGISLRSPVRFLAGLTLAIGGLGLLSGCGDRYPENLHYGLRTDVLVVKPPAIDPAHIDLPGQLHEWLINLAKEQGSEVLDPKKLAANQSKELEAALEKHFGTPSHPKVEGLDDDVIEALKLDKETLFEGSRLFRRHCLHCHGLTGNGQGPTAAWVNPHPRDYRKGVFKFTSSGQSSGRRKPRREDLLRTLRQGVEGTSMPAFGAQTNSQFGVLQDEDLQKLVSYVMHLSLRGQAEFDILSVLVKPDADLGDQSIEEYVTSRLESLSGDWRDAEENAIKPGNVKELTGDELQASITRGFKLFTSEGAASCIKCHTDFGRRNNYKYDTWGTVARPADLTLSEYRGGRRPIDFYWRIHAGVNGANMPDFSSSLKPEDIWDLVNFVRALPYPSTLPPEIREQIYEGKKAQVAER